MSSLANFIGEVLGSSESEPPFREFFFEKRELAPSAKSTQSGGSPATFADKKESGDPHSITIMVVSDSCILTLTASRVDVLTRLDSDG